MEKHPKKVGIIISTRKLTTSKWHELKPGELLLVKNGKILYSEIPHTQNHSIIIRELYNKIIAYLNIKKGLINE